MSDDSIDNKNDVVKDKKRVEHESEKVHKQSRNDSVDDEDCGDDLTEENESFNKMRKEE